MGSGQRGNVIDFLFIYVTKYEKIDRERRLEDAIMEAQEARDQMESGALQYDAYFYHNNCVVFSLKVVTQRQSPPATPVLNPPMM